MIRVIRVLEYEGDEDWVRNTLAERYVKGIRVEEDGKGIIREGFVKEADPIETWDEDAS